MRLEAEPRPKRLLARWLRRSSCGADLDPADRDVDYRRAVGRGVGALARPRLAPERFGDRRRGRCAARASCWAAGAINGASSSRRGGVAVARIFAGRTRAGGAAARGRRARRRGGELGGAPCFVRRAGDDRRGHAGCRAPVRARFRRGRRASSRRSVGHSRRGRAARGSLFGASSVRVLTTTSSSRSSKPGGAAERRRAPRDESRRRRLHLRDEARR